MRPETWSAIIIIIALPLTVFGVFLSSMLEIHECYQALRRYTLANIFVGIASSVIGIYLWHRTPIDTGQPLDVAILAMIHMSVICAAFAFFSFVALWDKKHRSQGQ